LFINSLGTTIPTLLFTLPVSESFCSNLNYYVLLVIVVSNILPKVRIGAIGTSRLIKKLVQHECIPQAILGTDVICQAKSGMGKTAVFVLAVLQQIDPQPGQVQSLVLCHTRELAYQICHEFDRFKVCFSKIPNSLFNIYF
jgi:hypothetical protein